MIQVSVVLPCYNAASALDACVDSILTQTGAELELIAVNDGSCDDTAQILDAWSLRDRRVRVFHRAHCGVAEAMNFGMAHCQSNLIARMDSDDICLPQRLERQMVHLNRHPHLGLVAGRVRFGGDAQTGQGYKAYVDWTNTLVSEDDIRMARFVESPLANPSIMLRKELVSRYGPFYDGPFPEDYEFLLRWLAAGVRMEKIHHEVLMWNDPPTRLTRTDQRYAPGAFYQIKAGYLAAWLLKRHIQRIAVIGAGRIARHRALLLEKHGIHITRWLDVDPRKIGQTASGRPVCPWHPIPKPGAEFWVSFVGNRGAGTRIAQELSAHGWIMGTHFLLAA